MISDPLTSVLDGPDPLSDLLGASDPLSTSPCPAVSRKVNLTITLVYLLV